MAFELTYLCPRLDVPYLDLTAPRSFSDPEARNLASGLNATRQTMSVWPGQSSHDIERLCIS